MTWAFSVAAGRIRGTFTCRAIAETNDVVIRTPGGTRRFSEQPGGSFVGSLLDPAQLTLQGGVFSLRETDGTVSRFNETTGRLLDVTDRNGHKVTLNYLSGTGRLVQLLHSNGDRFDFGYNAAGRLTQLTDQAGRVTTYAYDAAGEHLLERHRARRRLRIRYEHDLRRSRTSTH